MLAQRVTMRKVLDVDPNLPSHFRSCGPSPWRMLVHFAAAGTDTSAQARAPSLFDNHDVLSVPLLASLEAHLLEEDDQHH